MGTGLRHVRHAMRLLGRSPVFAATSVLSLAVGIGANSAIFSAANALLLAPTPGVRDMGRLVDIGRTTQGRGFDTVSFATYADLRDRESAFEGVYALRLETQPVSLGGDNGAERIYAEQVSGTYFDVLGLTPAAGTFFRSEEERLGVPLRKVVLSHAFWEARFGGRADVIGTDVVLNGDAFTVVGVGPRGYRGTTVMAPDVWVPLTSYAAGMPGDSMLRGRQNVWLIMAGRLKPGVSVAQAQQQLDAFAADLAREYPEAYRHFGLVVAPASRAPGVGREYVVPFLGVLMGVAGLVLLVTCANLAGLLLARSAARSREIAVRLALGASRVSLVGMLLIETLVVFALGGAAALVVAAGLTRALASALPALPVPIALDLSLDWRVLLFTTAIALIAALITGLAPALQSARRDLVTDIKADSGAPRRQRLRHAFVVTQLAACLVLVVVAGLFLRALGAATRVDPGFSIDGVEVATLDLALGGYADEQAPATAEAIRERLAGLPGVAQVGLSRMVPLDGGGLGLGMLRPKGATGLEQLIETDWNVVSPEYLDALGLPLRRGRPFTGADRQGAPEVAIVNERFAETVWPGEDPVGRQLEYGDFRPGRESSVRVITVVGIAANAKYRWVGEAPARHIYVPFAQQPMRDVNYLIRRSDRAAVTPMTPDVRAVLRTFNPNLPLVRLQSLRSYADLGLLPQRIAASLAGALGVLALLLAGIGIYGVAAFAVASRTREIGVRIALGAGRARVMRLVLWQGARLVLIGGAVGTALALGLTQLLSSLLFGVSPLDPVAYGATAIALGLVTLAATLIPARRAATVDPIAALRSE